MTEKIQVPGAPTEDAEAIKPQAVKAEKKTEAIKPQAVKADTSKPHLSHDGWVVPAKGR